MSHTENKYDWNNPSGPRPTGGSSIFDSIVWTIAQALHVSFEHARTGVLATGSIILIAVLVTVGINVTQPGPDVAAKQWMQAMADQDGSKLSELTCVRMRPSLQASLALPAAALILGQGFLGTQAKTDINDLKFTTQNVTGNTATVLIQGTIHQGIGLFSQAQQLNTTQSMFREDGKWRVCS